MDENFLQLYGNRTLENLTADWTDAKLSAESEPWLNFPPKEFLEFIAQYPETPFDSIPRADNHKRPPTYFHSQAHRMWLTSSKLDTQLKAIGARSFVDLGSFPFFVPMIMRDYFHFSGDIYVSTNLKLTAEGYAFLAKKNIIVFELDLDIYVSDPKDSGISRLPVSLPLDDGTVDLILFSHVIEHLYHPISILKECNRLLRPGGQVVITTDNAMMIEVFTNFIGGYGYIFEPVENTAAMTFSFWRGHVRFFTEKDLRTLLEISGFSAQAADFSHCFYDVFFEDFFENHIPVIANWKKSLLAETPWLRNDISVCASKN